MPRHSTSPFLFDDVLSISVTKLRKWKYLESGSFKSGTITWSRYGEVTSRLSIVVHFSYESPRLRLIYDCDRNSYDYFVYFESVPSNLGFGNVWYFTCPFTRRRCRKLHLINGQFMHRSNLRSGMYESQTKSKTWRNMESLCGAYFELDKHYEKLYSKHFKTHYNGKPTKRYVKLLQKINVGNRIDISAIKRLI